MRSDIVPGGTLPDFELPDHTRVPRKLSELQGDEDPLILTLARGHYCPKEHQQHLELAAFYSKIAVAYTRIVTVSTDEHHESQEFRASVGAQWPFLSDPGRVVQKDLDIQETPTRARLDDPVHARAQTGPGRPQGFARAGRRGIIRPSTDGTSAHRRRPPGADTDPQECTCPPST